MGPAKFGKRYKGINKKKINLDNGQTKVTIDAFQKY